MARRRSDGTYEVGYGRPPVATRFKPGQSGNPRGRPKGAKNVDTILRAVLMQQITVLEGGKRRKVTVFEVFLKRLSKQALEGDPKSGDKMIRLLPYLKKTEASGDATAAPDEGEDDVGRDGDRDMLRYFAQMVRDGALDLDDEEEAQ
ncbi:MAG: hypothetical protein F9K34_12145 [Albidovulum sp.]|uniref:DUF5681 domain-containing protein n=1 Tax=Albidovulum sp. TaxID=1872424 RepID=UPI001323A402|nr:DUF5681 domain-containing protein [Defluviimonas sp.]KAB2883318.1 MAG: hypothetical protein F9K34_12145 [Defluviimonas sp.]